MVRYWAGLLLRSWGSMGHARNKSSWTRDGHKHWMAQTLFDSIPHEVCWQLLLYCKHSSKIRQTDLLKAFPSISLFNLKGAASDSRSSTEWLKLHRAVLVKTFYGPSQLNHPGHYLKGQRLPSANSPKTVPPMVTNSQLQQPALQSQPCAPWPQKGIHCHIRHPRLSYLPHQKAALCGTAALVDNSGCTYVLIQLQVINAAYE